MQEYINFFSDHAMLSIGWVAIAGLLVYSLIKDKLTGVTSVSAQQATIMINRQNAIIVDLRSSDEYKRGHIINAKNITLSQIEKGNFTEIENHKQTPIILVCESGARYASAATKLVKAGFAQVNNLASGMGGWASANLPTTKK